MPFLSFFCCLLLCLLLRFSFWFSRPLSATLAAAGRSPPSRSPSCPLGFPPLKGVRLPRAKLICPWLPSFGGTLHWGGASLRSSLVRRLRGGSFVFFFSRIVLAPAGGKFGSSLRQIKGSRRLRSASASAALYQSFLAPLPCRPLPRRHPPPYWGAVIACFCLVYCSLRFNLVKSRCTSSLDKFLRSGFAAFRQKKAYLYTTYCVIIKV